MKSYLWLVLVSVVVFLPTHLTADHIIGEGDDGQNAENSRTGIFNTDKDPDFDNENFLRELRARYSDQGFSWVNLDEDIVLIGELVSVEPCTLKYAGVHPFGDEHQPLMGYGLYQIEPCRWIAGAGADIVSVLHASVVVLDQNNTICTRGYFNSPWLVPDRKLFLIAKPTSVVFKGSVNPQTEYIVSAIRYLEGDDCSSDEQPIFEYFGHALDPTRASAMDGIELARCIVLRKREAEYSLGEMIGRIVDR